MYHIHPITKAYDHCKAKQAIDCKMKQKDGSIPQHYASEYEARIASENQLSENYDKVPTLTRLPSQVSEPLPAIDGVKVRAHDGNVYTVKTIRQHNVNTGNSERVARAFDADGNELRLEANDTYDVLSGPQSDDFLSYIATVRKSRKRAPAAQ